MSILFSLLWGALRGLNEAMVMYFPNVREHPLFAWYHAGRVAEMAALIGMCYCLHLIVDTGKKVKSIIYVLGLLILSWEAFEVAYALGRCGQASGHENFLGVVSIDGAVAVAAVHAARIFGGAACIWYSRLF